MIINQKEQNNSGFTLIEIMVATSIFMIIMLISLGSLITSSDTAKKSQALRSAMDNVNFAMESMTRSLRMGSDYSCIESNTFVLPGEPTRDCPLGSSRGGLAIVFTPALDTRPRQAAYVVNQRSDGTNVLQSCYLSDPCVDLVSPDVDINQLNFFVSGSQNSTTNTPDDRIQPSIYILMKGTVIFKGEPITFAIQTNVSQRSAE